MALKKNIFTKTFFLIFIALAYLVVMLFILFHFGLLSNFSSVKLDRNKFNYLSQQVNVYDIDNKQLNQSLNQTKLVDYNSIPTNVVNAFVSIEDKNFFKHHGVNYKRIAKALLKNISSRQIKEGASTISQQLIKNTHLTNEKTFSRKLNELLLTKKLEKTMSKEQIITAYLNAIYFGSGAFGINHASQRFFSKDVSKLNLTEGATLAGIIKSPKLYSPISEPLKCKSRRNLVLKEMLKDKKITEYEYNTAINTPLNLKINKNFLGNNNYYSASIDEACEILKITEKDLIIKGYKVYTYEDSSLQKIVSDEIANDAQYSQGEQSDSLAMIIDNKTGGIKAFSGNSDYNLLSICRQPGSILKPIIVYAPALENNIISPTTPILDEEINISGYKPKNYNNKTYGWITAKEALAKSLNIPSIKILDYVGLDKAKTFASNLGLSFNKDDNGASLALGGLTNGLKFKDIANCYQAIANNGKQIKLGFVREITTKDGKIIYRHNTNPRQVMKDSTAFLLSDMLKEAVSNGTSKKLRLENLEICAKTGTVGASQSKTKENTDAWSLSYTPDITTCVWFGSTKKGSLLPKNVTGGSAPTSLAQSLYKKQELGNKKFEPPDSVKEVNINSYELLENNRLKLASKNTPSRYKQKAYFAVDNIPKETSNMFEEIAPFTLNLKSCKNNEVTLTFQAKKHLEYKVFKINGDNKTCIQTIKNKQGDVEIKDLNVSSERYYSYYVVATLLSNGSENKDQRVDSHSKSNNLLTALINYKSKNNVLTQKSNEIKIFLAQNNPLYIYKSEF